MKFSRLLMLLVALVLLATVGPSRAGAAPLVAAAGDIACPLDHYSSGGGQLSDDAGSAILDHACRQADTARLITEAGDYDAVLALGDLVDPDPYIGTFETSYESSWGAFKSITWPAVGNHEYDGYGADGYFAYFNGLGNSFGRAGEWDRGWHSHRLGRWLILALNSNCDQVACDRSSAQYRWLQRRLSENTRALRREAKIKQRRQIRKKRRGVGRPVSRRPLPAMPKPRGSQCILAYWHHPRFSSGIHGNTFSTRAFWRLLQRHGGDLILNGHDHLYERFSPQNDAGKADTTGPVQFTVGTGGRSLFNFQETPRANSEARVEGQFGILRLRLQPNSYRWAFNGIDRRSHDQGSRRCNRL